MSADTPSINDMQDELATAAGMEGTEVGGWWSALVQLGYHLRENGTETFREAYDAEIRAQYHILKTQYKVVPVEVRPNPWFRNRLVHIDE